MPKLFTNINEDLCVRAVFECFAGKWSRGDILSFIEEWTGIDRAVFKKTSMTGNAELKVEAGETIGMALYDVVADICAGKDIGDIIEPVRIEERVDGNSGKIRKIATLDIWHQLIGHTVKLSLDKLFHARLLPTQHASIPGKGQTRLKEQAKHYLHRNGLGIRYIQKTDVYHAYASTQYSIVTGLIRREIPRAKKTIRLLEFLGMLAPGGSLIIGGYLDAWLFNYAMSYALRELSGYGHERRGKVTFYVQKAETYMDDFGLMASTKSGLKKAVKKLLRWMNENLNLQLKLSTDIIALYPSEEENRRRKEKRASKRACPGLDMGGYVIHRTYTTIRSRNFIRARRQWLRGWKDLQEKGTLPLYRAQKIIAYNGFVKQTNSMNIRNKYHTTKLLEAAKRVVSYYGRKEGREREDKVNAVYERYCKRKARCCYN